MKMLVMLVMLVIVLMSLGCATLNKPVQGPDVVSPTHVTVDEATETHIPQVSLDLATVVATVCVNLSDSDAILLVQRIMQQCIDRSVNKDDQFFEMNCMHFACSVLRRAAAKSECSAKQDMNLWK
jgi:hypothetical protein